MLRTRASGPAAIVAVLLLAAGGSAFATWAPLERDNDAAILHVLNRIGYGPRPGDLEKVKRIGLREYIEDQLNPSRIPDPALAARLRPLTTLAKSSRELAEQYERPALEARRQRQRDAAASPDTRPEPPGPEGGRRPDMSSERRLGALPLLELSEQKLLRAVYSERQLETVLTDFWFNHFNVDARKGPGRFLLTEYERDAIRPHVLGNFRDLLEATAKSPGDAVLSRQLDERGSQWTEPRYDARGQGAVSVSGREASAALSRRK